MKRSMRLVVVPGVFRPRSDSWMLTESLRELSPCAGAETLDLCTGSGLAAIAAAQLGAAATAIDVSRRAVLTVRLNARLNGVARQLTALRGDLFAAVGARRFDLISANPPYVPSADGPVPAHGRARAWKAGPDGRAVIDRICDAAPGHLRAGGTLLLVQSSICGTDATLERLGRAGLAARVRDRRRGPLGPLMLSRARELERRGALRPGEREEELVVIEARRPVG
jgi:release factor glutamine methyltransferase